MNCRALFATAAGLIVVSPAILAGASVPADRTAGTPALSLATPATAADDGPLRTRATFSGPEENDDTETDSIYTKPVARMPRGRTTSPSGSTGSAATGGGGRVTGGGTSLASLPNANECIDDALTKLRGLEVNVALLGSHKYMVADCLGVKVSAGQFKLRFDNPKLSFVGGKVVFECGIDHVSFSAFKLRFKPNVENPLELCKFSKKHTVGGSADDIHLKVVFDPVVSDDHCRVTSLGAVDVTVRIGDLNMSGVQNDLDKAAKNMVEDALSVFLDYDMAIDLGFLIDHYLQAACGIVPQGDPFGGSGNRGGGGGSSAGDSALQQRIADLEGRVTALEQKLSGSTSSAATAPARTPPAEPGAGRTAPVAGASPPGTEATGGAKPRTAEPPGGVNARAASPAAAFTIVANPELKGRLGRLVIAFPAGTKDLNARTGIRKAGGTSELRADHGNATVELTPGTYDLDIGGQLVKGVVVQTRSDTRVNVGVLRVTGSKSTRFGIFAAGGKVELQALFGTSELGLPAGSFDVEVNGQRETVTITAGAITEY